MLLCKLLQHGSKCPERKHRTDAGFDIYMPAKGVIENDGRKVLSTGIALSLPIGWAGLVRPRSSVFLKGIHIHGTIDCGYQGEIKLMVHNHSGVSFEWAEGDRLAQIVPVFTGPNSYPDATYNLNNCNEIKVVGDFPETNRGDGGFGSTGK